MGHETTPRDSYSQELELLKARVEHLEKGVQLIRATIAWYSYVLPDRLLKKLEVLVNEILDPSPQSPRN